jgi:hypothetical protein
MNTNIVSSRKGSFLRVSTTPCQLMEYLFRHTDPLSKCFQSDIPSQVLALGFPQVGVQRLSFIRPNVRFR